MLLSSLVRYLRTIPRGKVRHAAKAMKPRQAILALEWLVDGEQHRSRRVKLLPFEPAST